MGDFIKIYRSMLEWEWYSDINTCRLFIHMLLKANWKEGKFQGTTVPRGSFVSSIGKLAEETQLTQREVRTAISHLKMTGELTSKATNKFTVFTVINYNSYQSTDMQNDNQATSERHSNDIQTTTIEEKKEIKKGRSKDKRVSKDTPKEKSPYYPNDELLDRAFCDYVEMRKQIKKPLATDRAITLAMNKLQQLATLPFSEEMNNDLAIKILEQSVMNSWQGLFPLKENNAGKSGETKGGIDWSAV